MPDSQVIANMFAAAARGDVPEGTMSEDVMVGNPQVGDKLMGYSTHGHTMQKVEHDYDPKPMRKNPRAMDEQEPSDGMTQDAEGYPLGTGKHNPGY